MRQKRDAMTFVNAFKQVKTIFYNLVRAGWDRIFVNECVNGGIVFANKPFAGEKLY